MGQPKAYSELIKLYGKASLFFNQDTPIILRVSIQCVVEGMADAEGVRHPESSRFRFIFEKQPRMPAQAVGKWRISVETDKGNCSGPIEIEVGRMAARSAGPFSGTLIESLEKPFKFEI